MGSGFHSSSTLICLCRIFLHATVGTTTLVPHKTQPLSQDNLYFLEAYGVRVGSALAGHHSEQNRVL